MPKEMNVCTPRSLLLVVLLMVVGTACERQAGQLAKATTTATVETSAVSDAAAAANDSRELPLDDLAELLRQAERIPNSTGWFEILALPNDVYALWEPGHFEKVNSFLIVGADKDLLYDTGMGIASIGTAVAELRATLQRQGVPLMVVNSHNHLDHNGGNAEFEEAWIIRNEWAIRKLTEGVVGGFAEYWAGVTPHEGVQVPASFDPQNFRIRPFPAARIRFLADGDVVDLGNRRFRVIHTQSHSPDGLALYDAENRLFFGGDTFMGDAFLIRDLDLLAGDLSRIAELPIAWHYASHGPQLIQTMRDGWRLSIVRRMLAGEREETTTQFAGMQFPLYRLDGVEVTLATEFLTY